MFHGGKMTFLFFVAMLAIGAMAFAQPASELLEKGFYAEETEGDLDAAIGIYERIVEDDDANRAHIAKAQFRLGVCYVKKGMDADAAAAFRKVVERYADQPALVAQARVRLTNLGFGTNGETLAMSTRLIWAQARNNTGAPSPDGRYITYVNLNNNADLAVHDQARLDEVAAELNGRPRQTLSWLTPSEAFARAVAMTA